MKCTLPVFVAFWWPAPSAKDVGEEQTGWWFTQMRQSKEICCYFQMLSQKSAVSAGFREGRPFSYFISVTLRYLTVLRVKLKNITSLQPVQNTTALLLTNPRRQAHISPMLASSLVTTVTIDFKISLIIL